jgi:hypothetical protein
MLPRVSERAMEAEGEAGGHSGLLEWPEQKCKLRGVETNKCRVGRVLWKVL